MQRLHNKLPKPIDVELGNNYGPKILSIEINGEGPYRNAASLEFG